MSCVALVRARGGDNVNDFKMPAKSWNGPFMIKSKQKQNQDMVQKLKKVPYLGFNIKSKWELLLNLAGRKEV